MVNDHLSDLVTRIRNGYLAGRTNIEMPSTKMVERVVAVLAKEGYVGEVSKNGQVLSLALKYDNKEPVMAGIRRVSKPGARVYASVKDLPRVWGGLGMNILSTPKGVMSEKEARKLNCGGELIAQVW